MAKFAVLVSLIALVISILAYQRAGGSGGPQEIQSLQRAMEVMRKETADALARIERSIRPDEKSEGSPAKPKP